MSPDPIKFSKLLQQELLINPTRREVLMLANGYEKIENHERALYYYILSLLKYPSQSLFPMSRIIQLLHKTDQKELLKYCKTYGNLPQELIRRYFPDKPFFDIELGSANFKKNIIYRPHKKEIKLLDDRGVFKKENLTFDGGKVYEIENALVYADLNTTAVISSENNLLEAFSTGCSNIIPGAKILKEAKKISGNVAFLCNRWGSKAFFHWLLGLLPKLHLLQSHKAYRNIDYVYMYDPSANFNQESLEALGISSDFILDASTLPAIKCEKLFIPKFSHGVFIDTWVIDFLMNTFLKINQPLKEFRYIYIRRTNKRVLLDEEVLIEELLLSGFKVVELEKYSLVEQASILYSADKIIAPHGAGLSNIVYCRKNTVLLELFSPHYVNNCFEKIARIKDMNYQRYIGGEHKIPNKGAVMQDILIDFTTNNWRSKINKIINKK